MRWEQRAKKLFISNSISLSLWWFLKFLSEKWIILKPVFLSNLRVTGGSHQTSKNIYKHFFKTEKDIFPSSFEVSLLTIFSNVPISCSTYNIHGFKKKKKYCLAYSYSRSRSTKQHFSGSNFDIFNNQIFLL